MPKDTVDQVVPAPQTVAATEEVRGDGRAIAEEPASTEVEIPLFQTQYREERDDPAMQMMKLDTSPGWQIVLEEGEWNDTLFELVNYDWYIPESPELKESLKRESKAVFMAILQEMAFKQHSDTFETLLWKELFNKDASTGQPSKFLLQVRMLQSDNTNGLWKKITPERSNLVVFSSSDQTLPDAVSEI